jgi:hypothetical protein
MKTNKPGSILKTVGTGIGVGLIAGIAGTAAITMSQMIEMRLTKRKAGVGPANAVGKTLKIQAVPGTKHKLSTEIHWVYGTLWGVVRGILGITGAGAAASTAAHFTAITAAGMAMAPLEGQASVKEWSAKEISIDLLHHAVYAVAAGCVFDYIYNSKD